MSAIIKSETISRRKVLSLMGLAAAFGLAVSDAEAQTAAPTPAAPTAAAPVAAAPTGVERRQERRTARTERRQARRTARTERRQERRTARTERRQERRTGSDTTTGTGTGEKK